MTKLVAYYRVSTKRQGASGLGLDGQKAAVAAYALQVGATVMAEYIEIESGRKSDRPELAKALSCAKRSRAVLCVAKLDRLARSVAFTAALQDSGVKFVCGDNPSATEMTINILASVAQGEAKAISERTKAALAAAKARGTKLGSHRPGHWRGREQERLAGLEKARQRAAELNKQTETQAYVDIYPVVTDLRANGLSLRDIAAELNAMGHTTRRGKPWNPMQVSHVLKRAA